MFCNRVNIGGCRGLLSLLSWQRVPAVLGIVLCSVWCCILSQNRLIARDEGFYAVAAELVTQGKTPYHDFFYPQAPLQPYVYGALGALLGHSWPMYRAITAAVMMLFGVGLFLTLRRESGRAAGMCGLVLFSSATLSLAWLPIVKGYGLSSALLFAAYLAFIRSLQTGARRWSCAAGALLGLSCLCRIYLSALLPLFLAWIVLQKPQTRHGTLRHALCFCGSFAITVGGLLLPLLLEDPYRVWWNNIEYHLQRQALVTSSGIDNKLEVLSTLLGVSPNGKFDGLQFAILVWFNTLATVAAAVNRVRPEFSTLIGFAVFLISLGPSPTYVQYAVISVPFLIHGAVRQTIRLLHELRGRPVRRRLLQLGVCAALAAFLAPVMREADRYLRTGDKVIGIRSAAVANQWSLHTAQSVTAMVSATVSRGDQVLALWPGHLLGSGAVPLPGTENQFGRQIARLLPDDMAQWLRIKSKEELLRIVREGGVRWVLLPVPPARSEYYTALKEGSYTRYARLLTGGESSIELWHTVGRSAVEQRS